LLGRASFLGTLRCSLAVGLEGTRMPNERILVVEDERLVREVIVEVLTEAGFQVDEAETGDDAAKLIDADGYTLILTDINMPGHLDGIDLATHAHKKKPGIPIVFMTGCPESSERAQARGALVIHKPYSPATVVRAVRALLSHKD